MIPLQALVGSSAVPVQVGNFLRVQANYNIAVDTTATLRAIVLAANGTLSNYEEQLVLPAASLTVTNLISLEDGLLLNAFIDVNGSGLAPGTLYVQLGVLVNELDQDRNVLKLTSGYVSDGQFLAFPYSRPAATTDQTSPPVSSTPPDPGPGTDFSVGASTNAIATLTAFNFTYDADANAANRRITVHMNGQSGLDIPFRTRTDITANQGWLIVGWLGTGLPADDTTARIMYVPIPDQFTGAGIGLQVVTLNIQAGDQISGIVIQTTGQAGF